MTETNKTSKTSRTRGAAKSMTEEKFVVPGQNEADVHPEEQEPIAAAADTATTDDGLTEEERAVLNGRADLNGNRTAAATEADPESGLDPKAALLALASSEIQGFGSNFVESVITSAQENSKMAANMIRQYPQLFYILTLQELAGSAFTGGGGTEAELGKSPLPIGGMESGYQQFLTVMSQAKQTVLRALPEPALKQLQGQEETTQ